MYKRQELIVYGGFAYSGPLIMIMSVLAPPANDKGFGALRIVVMMPSLFGLAILMSAGPDIILETESVSVEESVVSTESNCGHLTSWDGSHRGDVNGSRNNNWVLPTEFTDIAPNNCAAGNATYSTTGTDTMTTTVSDKRVSNAADEGSGSAWATFHFILFMVVMVYVATQALLQFVRP